MSGAGGKWMVSSITEGDIKKLRRVGYLPDDEGQLIPTSQAT